MEHSVLPPCLTVSGHLGRSPLQNKIKAKSASYARIRSDAFHYIYVLQCNRKRRDHTCTRRGGGNLSKHIEKYEVNQANLLPCGSRKRRHACRPPVQTSESSCSPDAGTGRSPGTVACCPALLSPCANVPVRRDGNGETRRVKDKGEARQKLVVSEFNSIRDRRMARNST